jgi:predicted dehydrogenase
MKNKTRVLVVGLGSIGQRHARLLSERSDIELLLCDPVDQYRMQTLAALVNPQEAEYPEFSIALEADPDIVFVCVPNHLHVPIGLQAIENGVDIFVEKPISDSLKAARTLVKAAETAGRFLQVGYMMRLDEGLLKLKKIVDCGDLGNLVGGRAMIGTYITLLNAKNSDRINHPNSLIVDYTHELDFVSWFFGEIADLSAMGTSIGDLELRPHPNLFQINLRMKTGALVQVHMDYIQYPQRRIFEIYGDRGTLTYDFMTGQIRQYSFQRDYQWTDHSVLPITDRWDDLFRKEHEAMILARGNGEPPIVTGRDGLKALEIAERAIANAI